MKKIKVAFIFFLCFLTSIKGQSPISTVVNRHHLGAWAYKQHEEILEKIEHLVSCHQIDLYNEEGKHYNYPLIRKNYLEYIKKFDNESYPSYESDTNYYFLRPYYSSYIHTNRFYISEGHYQFYIGNNGWVNVFRKELDSFMTREQLDYLSLFCFDEEINGDSIPARSTVVYNKMKRAIFNESFDPLITVYSSPFLRIDDTCYRSLKGFGGFERVVFIYTDPDDSTIGKDSSYRVPVPYDTSIVNRYISVTFMIQDSIIKISALGSYMVTSIDIYGKYLDKQTIGYLALKDVRYLDKLQIGALNAMLLIKIDDKLGLGNYYENRTLTTYRNRFQISISEEGD